MTPLGQLEYLDERTLRGADGARYDVLEAVQQLPWVRQLCPFMPHEYAILRNSPEQAWFVVESMIRLSPNSHRAFFRGYQVSESLLGGTGRPPLLARSVRDRPMGRVRHQRTSSARLRRPRHQGLEWSAFGRERRWLLRPNLEPQVVAEPEVLRRRLRSVPGVCEAARETAANHESNRTSWPQVGSATSRALALDRIGDDFARRETLPMEHDRSEPLEAGRSLEKLLHAAREAFTERPHRLPRRIARCGVRGDRCVVGLVDRPRSMSIRAAALSVAQAVRRARHCRLVRCCTERCVPQSIQADIDHELRGWTKACEAQEGEPPSWALGDPYDVAALSPIGSQCRVSSATFVGSGTLGAVATTREPATLITQRLRQVHRHFNFAGT